MNNLADYDLTGEVRNPKDGEYFIHSNSITVIKSTGDELVKVPLLGSKRVIVKERGHWRVNMTRDQFEYLKAHPDIKVRNAMSASKWVTS